MIIIVIIICSFACCRLACLSEDVILKTLRVQSLMQISVLNLHGNSLTKLKCLQGMTLLRKLIISFNEMTRLDDLAHMVQCSLTDVNIFLSMHSNMQLRVV